MKKLILIASLSISGYCIYGQIYTAKSGEVTFFSEAPLENIEAVNKVATSLLNTASNDIAFSVTMIAFEFEKALMREHFNENYMETEKYPKALFKGKLNEMIDFTKDGTYQASATGKLTIHGVEQDRTIEGTLTVKEGQILLKTEFKVLLKDHNIKIPKLVVKNLAEEVLVTVTATYAPYKK